MSKQLLLGTKCEEYGGVWTDISTLKDGTDFYVHNGNWYGRIKVHKNGTKTLKIYEWLTSNRKIKPRFEYEIHDNDIENNILAISLM